MSERIKLGDLVKDVYSGFTGVAASKAEFLHGCLRIGIEPTKLNKDGNKQEMEYFDEPRVKVIKRQEIKDLSKPEPRRKTGGPQKPPRRNADPRR